MIAVALSIRIIVGRNAKRYKKWPNAHQTSGTIENIGNVELLVELLDEVNKMMLGEH